MEGNSSADGVLKAQPVLGDITNRLGKRGLSLISGDSGNKIDDHKEENSQFTQRVCQGVENIVKEKCGIRTIGNDNDNGKRVCVSPRPCSEINPMRGNIVPSVSKVLTEIKDSNSFISSVQLSRDDADIDNVVEVDEATRDTCASGILLPITSVLSDGGKGTCDYVEEQATAKIAEGEVSVNDYGIIGGCNFTAGKHGIVEYAREPESQVLGLFRLAKCKGQIDDGNFNSSAGVDLIKACSCSFCVKVAYIWSDLHYQDVKGRIAALKKSQKEASIMRERSCRNKGIDKQGQGNHYKRTLLESDLTGQWRSLFLHMENIFEREGNQLEASLLSLKDLRGNCKTELEMVNGMPKEKH